MKVDPAKTHHVDIIRINAPCLHLLQHFFAMQMCIRDRPTLEGLPFYIARSEGIYDSLGLDLTILPFHSAKDRDAVFQTGQYIRYQTNYFHGTRQNHQTLDL